MEKTSEQQALETAQILKNNREKIDAAAKAAAPVKEINGLKGLEPTRYGDWEKGGIASDF